MSLMSQDRRDDVTACLHLLVGENGNATTTDDTTLSPIAPRPTALES